MTKKIIYIIAGIILIGAVVVVVRSLTHRGGVAGAAITNSSVGSTNSSSKIASISFVPSTGTATGTSMLNTDSVDRNITESFVQCSNATTTYTAYTGAGLASWNFKAATTSTSNPTLALADVNANYALNANIATTSVSLSPGVAAPAPQVTYVASSTEGILTFISRIWPTNTYLTFQSNATSTATCTAGVKYFTL